RGAHRPATRVLERLREVPVEEGDPWLDARGEERVHQPRVEIQARAIDGAATGRDHSRPRNRESVCANAELLHQCDVTAPEVVMVACHVAVAPVLDALRRDAELVPYRGSAPV